MKKLIITLTIAFMALSSWAQTFSSNNLKYVIISDIENTVEFTGLEYDQMPESLTIPNTVSHNGKTYKVVSMREDIFPHNPNLDTNKALRYLRIGDNIEEIPENMFGSFVNLHTVDLGSGVKKIGDYAFDNCKSLTNVIFHEGLEEIGAACFGNTALKSVKLPNSVLYVNMHPFFACTQLESIEFGSSVKWFGLNILQGCTALRYVSIAATEVPRGQGANTFGADIAKNIYVHVPRYSGDLYRNDNAFKVFKGVVDDLLTNKCPDPAINVSNGKVSFTCPMPNAKFEYTVTYFNAPTNSKGTNGSFDLQKPDVYATISVVATKEDYAPSNTISKSISYNDVFSISTPDVNADGYVNSADVVEIYNYIISGN